MGQPPGRHPHRPLPDRMRGPAGLGRTQRPFPSARGQRGQGRAGSRGSGSNFHPRALRAQPRKLFSDSPGPARACPDRPSPTGCQRSKPRSSLRARPGYPQGPTTRAASNFVSCLKRKEQRRHQPCRAAPPVALPRGARRIGPVRRPTARGLGLGLTPAGRGHDELSTGAAAAATAAAAPGYTREPDRSRRDAGTRTPQSSAHTPCAPGRTPAQPRLPD